MANKHGSGWDGIEERRLSSEEEREAYRARHNPEVASDVFEVSAAAARGGSRATGTALKAMAAAIAVLVGGYSLNKGLAPEPVRASQSSDGLWRKLNEIERALDKHVTQSDSAVVEWRRDQDDARATKEKIDDWRRLVDRKLDLIILKLGVHQQLGGLRAPDGSQPMASAGGAP